jgi:hydrogenase expression/formation protein HypD
MEFIEEFRNSDHVSALVKKIAQLEVNRELTFMEVCGTHTMAISRFGIRELLPKNVRLISGPGCPVCVTDNAYLDHAIALARQPNTIITTFGDMMRVPASTSSLTECRAEGCDVRVVTSTIEALELARANQDKEVVFLGVGFETTTPTIAASIKIAHDENLKNYSVLSAHKLVPPALEALLAGPLKLDGFLLPGHVSAIIGGNAYRDVMEDHYAAAVIAGFEPSDILHALAEAIEQITKDRYSVKINYKRAVSDEGNTKAMRIMNEVFEPCDAIWRGIGTIPKSGLKIRQEYSEFDAAKMFEIEVEKTREHKGCRCGEILQGLAQPADCPLFGNGCTPEHPIGACMVSSEGTCAAYYRYG